MAICNSKFAVTYVLNVSNEYMTGTGRCRETGLFRYYAGQCCSAVSAQHRSAALQRVLYRRPARRVRCFMYWAMSLWDLRHFVRLCANGASYQ